MFYKKIATLLILSSFIVSCSQNIQNNETLLNKIATFDSKKKADVSKPDVIKMISPNSNERPEGTKISAVVLHHTAMAADAKAVGNFFANPNAKVSSHYIVDRTGYIVQPVEDELRAWHAGKSGFQGMANVNNFSIGIEICNLGDSVEPYPDAEYDSIIRLVAYLVKTYNLKSEDITRHKDIAIPAGRKIDTSDNFSVKRVLDGVEALLNGNYNPPAPQQPAPVELPLFKDVIVKKGEFSLKILADIYLDDENRWQELKLANPNIPVSSIQVGTQIKIPTTYAFFDMLFKK